jgi:hypothetical protein
MTLNKNRNSLSDSMTVKIKIEKGMKYNPNVIEAKWQNIGQKIKHLPLQTTLKNQSIMC